MEEPIPRRERATQRLAALLLRRGSPRFQMLLFLAATGLTGFLASVFLHAIGLHSMALRYPLAVGVAYLVFFGLLCMFVAYHRRRRTRYPANGQQTFADDVYYVDYGSPHNVSVGPSTSSSTEGGGGGGINLGGDGDGLLVLVVVVLICIAVGSAVCASLYLLVEAPLLLAEVLADGVLLVGLARRIDPQTGPHWSAGVIRRTVLPLIIVAACLGVVGLALQLLVPGATTMGEALRMARSQS